MNNEWEKFGKDIKDLVDDAINSQDFNQLNKAITNSVNEAVNTLQKGLKTAGDAVNRASFLSYQNKEKQREWERNCQNNQYGQNSLKVPNTDVSPELFKKNTSLKAGGWVLAVCGYTFSAGIGITIMILFLVSFFLGSFPIGIKIALSVLVPLLLGSGIMAWKGSSILSGLKRYRNYIAQLRGRTYCNIKELADKNGKSFRFVAKDLKKMIEKGWFRQGHLDHDNTCLIVSHDTYQEYQNIQKQRIEQIQLETERQNRSKTSEGSRNPEVEKVISEGKEYIRKIRECNQNISEEEITSKISHMEMLIQKIFDRVKEDPDALDDIQKLMEYYLPTTVKLLEAYQQLDSQPVQGENIRSSKTEIEQTLDTLNLAFERLLDSLFEEVAWDVSSDISVLHTMLAQEGLTGNDFK
ncbi:hypothetical protein E5329_12355 [Petralouisia muris]|uniref:Uncharacterized protein n=1 Tax=Petralouisia muris TaxID=3032872 RepID=A0AC61RVX8_9FIRM|nr:5-bromo-4-chloroindolyl phosphate hydrolysis family protein [Petralouisia muris]TGY95945.1 hypothetical protein E5329_12355 [Petralouisia muris]